MEQKILSRDVRQLLDHGDEFGLLPDQFFYRANYPQVNGKDRSVEKNNLHLSIWWDIKNINLMWKCVM